MTIAAGPGVDAARVGTPTPAAARARHVLRLLVGAAGLAIGILVAWRRASVTRTNSAVDVGLVVARGWVYIAAGMIAWYQRPHNRVVLLLLGVGFTSFLLPLAVATGPDTFFSLARGLDFLYVAALFHLVLAYPSGTLSSWTSRVSIVGLYVVLGGVGLARIATCSPEATWEGGACFSVTGSLHPDAALSDALHRTYLYGALGLLIVLSALVVFRWATATAGPGRGVLALIHATALTQAGLYGFLIATELWVRLSNSSSVAVSHAQSWLEVAMPVAFLVALLRPRLGRASVARLVVDLREPRELGQLQPVLARALRDPSLDLGFWSPVEGRYVDSEGRPFELPSPDSGRSVSELKRGQDQLAVLVHDPSLLEDPGLVDAVGAAAGLALENERLQAVVRAQLEEVRASRSRIVEAADTERRRVERDLHDGAQQRLLTLGIALRRAQRRLGTQLPEVETMLAEATAELDSALNEIRELARGIYPVILSDGGLESALEALADRSPVPVVLRVSVGGRFPASIETTAYFVVSEALTNVAKYAEATEVRVVAERSKGMLTLEVADDGKGEADPDRGSGLRGLADRAAAVGGSLRIETARGHGTRIIVELPFAGEGG